MDPPLMDEMIMDILGMKKNAPIDSATKIDYMDFAAKIFDKDYAKKKAEADPKNKNKNKNNNGKRK
jgi:hypothetical protein